MKLRTDIKIRKLAAFGVWALLFVFAEPLAVSAAGFNCAPYLRSGKCPEVAICQNPELSNLDSLMNRLYRDLLRQTRGRERADVKKDQREFIGYRNSCGCNVECLGEAYRSQTKGLGKSSLTMGKSKPNRSSSSGNTGGKCSRKPNAAQREICRDPVLADLDVSLNEVYQNLRNVLNTSEKSNLRRSQLNWLKRRDRCGADFDCLNGLYRSRIRTLDDGGW